MANQEFYSRIIHKHDTEENWIKAVNFIPKQGEIIIYDKDDNYGYERMKIGDGTSKVNDLPFNLDQISDTIADLGALTIDLEGAIEGEVTGVNATTFQGYTIDKFVMYNINGEDGDIDTTIDADMLGGHLPEYFAIANTQGINTYIHSAGTLTGTGENGKFKATVSETVSSLTINGTACIVKCGEESEIELVSGAWYTFVLDGTTINFRGGGGLTNSKLALATATENDVLAGLTFYAGDKELKIGTMEVISKAELAEALQYSGLGITEDSTPEEIYEALATAFPADLDLFAKGIFNSAIGGWSVGSVSSNIHSVSVSMGKQETVYHYSQRKIDVTDYSQLVVIMPYYNCSSSNTATIGLASNTTGTFVKSTTINDFSSATTLTFDVSSLTGSYYLELMQKSGSTDSSYSLAYKFSQITLKR